MTRYPAFCAKKTVTQAAIGILTAGLFTYLCVALHRNDREWLFAGSIVAYPHWFADIRIVYEGAALMNDGRNPLTQHAMYNYPLPLARVIGIASSAGIDIYTFGLILNGFLLVFTACIFAHIAKYRSPKVTLLVFVFVAFSPATILALDRANSDLLIAALLVAALFVLRGRSRYLRLGGYALLSFATLLKIFPVFAVAISLGERTLRRCLVTAVVVISAGLCYFVIASDELMLISTRTPRPAAVAFGALVFWTRVPAWFAYAGFRDPSTLLPVIQAFAASSGLVAYGVGLLSGVRLGSPKTKRCLQDDLFVVGATIYCGCFCVIGSSWLYRALFLIFCLPQLLVRRGSQNVGEERTDEFRKTVVHRALVVGCIVVVMWQPYLEFQNKYVGIILGITANWLLFYALAFALGRHPIMLNLRNEVHRYLPEFRRRFPNRLFGCDSQQASSEMLDD